MMDERAISLSRTVARDSGPEQDRRACIHNIQDEAGSPKNQASTTRCGQC